MKKEVRIQIRLDRSDVKVIDRLVKLKKFGSNRSEVLRRGLICLTETDEGHWKGNIRQLKMEKKQ